MFRIIAKLGYCFVACFFSCSLLYAQEADQHTLIDYKVVGDDTLRLHVFEPEVANETGDDTAALPRPAIVFFFGGGWVNGHPRQFYPHAAYFASRGVVAISAEYRIRSIHDTTPFESVADAKSAVRWIRANAAELNIDPEKIVAAGGSAGGHVAATTGVVPGQEDAYDDLSISSKPAAMILFNPVLDLTPEKWQDRFAGRSPMPISPIHQVDADQPPALIFHGTIDKTVPISQAQRFCTAMTHSANACRLMRFDGMDHGFFNRGRHGNKPYVATVKAADEFLIELGILDGTPTIDQ